MARIDNKMSATLFGTTWKWYWKLTLLPKDNPNEPKCVWTYNKSLMASFWMVMNCLNWPGNPTEIMIFTIASQNGRGYVTGCCSVRFHKRSEYRSRTIGQKILQNHQISKVGAQMYENNLEAYAHFLFATKIRQKQIKSW